MTWRLIADDTVSASFGLAADEALAGRVGRGESPPTLRLYTYASHCALVGRHQSIDAEIDRAFCQAHGIAINRRSTGGGAIIMGDGQLGIALITPLDSAIGQAYRVRDLFMEFSQGITAGLETLGIAAEFGGKNDIQVGQKKIAGLGITQDPSGGLLFHASVLVDLDIALMLRVLKMPLEKISDKAISTVAERTTTVRRETGQAVPMDTVRRAIAGGYTRLLGISLEPGTFTAEELAAIRELEQQKYLSQEWIEQESRAEHTNGRARRKTPGGLVNVDLALEGEVIKAVYVTGDFFAEPQHLTTLERSLRWRPAEPSVMQRCVAEVLEQAPGAFEGISVADLVGVILAAVEDARR